MVAEGSDTHTDMVAGVERDGLAEGRERGVRTGHAALVYVGHGALQPHEPHGRQAVAALGQHRAAAALVVHLAQVKEPFEASPCNNVIYFERTLLSQEHLFLL